MPLAFLLHCLFINCLFIKINTHHLKGVFFTDAQSHPELLIILIYIEKITKNILSLCIFGVELS